MVAQSLLRVSPLLDKLTEKRRKKSQKQPVLDIRWEENNINYSGSNVTTASSVGQISDVTTKVNSFPTSSS